MARLVLYGLWVTPALVTCSLLLCNWLALGLELYTQARRTEVSYHQLGGDISTIGWLA